MSGGDEVEIPESMYKTVMLFRTLIVIRVHDQDPVAWCRC